MRPRTQQTTPGRWMRLFLAALVAVLATILSSASASAATTTGAETRVRASNLAVGVLVEPPQQETAGQRLGNDRLGVETTVATGVAANTASKVGPTTAHGAERIAGAGATRGGVLAEDEILLVRDAGQLLTQADGAAVRVLQNEAGRFNVVVDGERGLITSFSNLSQKSLERLGTRYGWE
ncbi:MAG: hypothetical protein H0X12_10640 [Nocardioides sp.]|nr:hypothetical protein [Nocardioides sp.]